VKVLTGGAFKRVLLAAVPAFEREAGHQVTVVNDTVGALVRRIEFGETFDVVIVSPSALERLAGMGKVLPDVGADLAKVGIGVMVKAGAPKADVSSVEAFKQAVLNAVSVGYIDPESGGSSGIYLAGLFARLGIAGQIASKVRLKRGGGHVSDLVLSGDVELGIHQMSEIVSTEGVTLAGPLPDAIQNFTTYSAGIGAAVSDREAAEALITFLTGAEVSQLVAARGMLRP
jgi:molybdate transport system substrate-binding protein